jgi:hypothetical protein
MLNVPSLVVLLVMGAVLAASYALLAWRKGSATGYIGSPLWLGMERSTVIMLVFLQALAAVGFLSAVLTWVFFAPPSGGVLSYHPAVLPVVLGVFLASSAAWAFLMSADDPNKIAVSASLVVTAVASIVLVAGAAEETRPRWWVVGGTLLLALVTVLGDGVAWNARWLMA